MALIQCPDCGKQISDAAPTCVNCGRPNGTTPPTANRIDASRSGSKVACPFCHNPLPDKNAQVCLCGAYYGYNNVGAPTQAIVGVVCLFIALVCYGVAATPSSGDSSTVAVRILCGLGVPCFALGGLGGVLTGGIAMMAGKKWYRKF
jgi:hypothetical protein